MPRNQFDPPDPFAAPVKVARAALYDDEVPAEVPRDRWRRPLILQPDDSLAPYTRVSTACGALDSGHGLGIWKLRHAALSIARHEDIAAMVAGLEYGDPALDELLEQACDRSAAMVEARHWGTAVHTFTEAGPDHPRREYVPERMRADVDSYDRALERAGLELIESELFVVNERWRVAGTLDGLYLEKHSGLVIVADKKTGALHPNALAAQLAMYAAAERYDPVTGARSPLHPDLDPERLLGIEIVRGEGRTHLHRIDGFQAGKLASLAVRIHAVRAAERNATFLSPWEELPAPETGDPALLVALQASIYAARSPA